LVCGWWFGAVVAVAGQSGVGWLGGFDVGERVGKLFRQEFWVDEFSSEA